MLEPYCPNTKSTSKDTAEKRAYLFEVGKIIEPHCIETVSMRVFCLVAVLKRKVELQTSMHLSCTKVTNTNQKKRAYLSNKCKVLNTCDAQLLIHLKNQNLCVSCQYKLPSSH